MKKAQLEDLYYLISRRSMITEIKRMWYGKNQTYG